MNYFASNQKDLSEIAPDQIEKYYQEGYVLTRLGNMNQTRSIRIDLDKFDFSSENRRVMRKVESLVLRVFGIPLQSNSSSWAIHKMGRDFYANKFHDVEFSANKIREMILSPIDTKFNLLLGFFEKNIIPNQASIEETDFSKATGYAICYQGEKMLHYAYPFYDLSLPISNIGMGMILHAISWAKANNLKYFYLGSFSRPADIYKLQFHGLEWWDDDKWNNDLEKLRSTIK